jgi:hypothetical protein
MATAPIMQMAAEGKAEDLWQEMREKADSSLYWFAKVVMNYRDLTDHFHLPLCVWLQNNMDELLTGVLMQRGSFKSTIGTKAYMLWRYLRNHEEGILVLGESDTVAKKALIDVKWHCLNNQLLRWLYPELKGIDPSNTKWTDSEILLPREGSYDEPTFTCDGIGAKRTGFHYSEIIFDDPIGDKAAASEAVMDAAWEWIEYSRGLLREAGKSRRSVRATRWKHGTGDVYGRMMVAMPEMKWYIRSAIENGEPTFPERQSLAILGQIRQEQGDYKFNCQYMNNPTAPGGADFEAHWIQEYDVDPNDGHTIIPCDGSPRIDTGQLLRMGMYDVSSGGKTANCENAIIAAGMDYLKRIFVLEDFGENCTIGQAVEKYHVMNDRWKLYHAHYELVGAQKAVEDFANERKHQSECPYCPAGHLEEDGKLFRRNPHRKLTLIGIKPPGGSMSKEERIRLYAQKPFEERRVYLRRGMTALRAQIVEFPHGALVDRFDALAYLCHLLRPPISDNEESSDKAAQLLHKVAGKPFTHQEYDRGGYA